MEITSSFLLYSYLIAGKRKHIKLQLDRFMQVKPYGIKVFEYIWIHDPIGDALPGKSENFGYNYITTTRWKMTL